MAKCGGPNLYQHHLKVSHPGEIPLHPLEAAAKSLQSGMNPRPKKKAKTRQSGKAEKDTTDAAADGNSAITP